MHRLKAHWLQVLAHILSLLPLAIIVWDFTQGQLTANPIQEITLRTGRYSLILLVLSLACTPINSVFGFKSVLRLRRPLGLYGFMYAGLHTLNFIGLDYGFDFGLIRDDLFGKAYIWAGVLALLALLPTAITSTRGWIRRLGKNWERLHRLVYLAILLSVGHFLLLVKVDIRRPLLYGAIVVVLLAIRLPGVRRSIDRLLHRSGSSAPLSQEGN